MENDSKALSHSEVRRLVDAYFAFTSQRNVLGEHGSSPETEIYRVLETWTQANPPARWATSIVGVTPPLAAGLAAHIDIETSPTVGRIWRYAGLDPSTHWRHGERRPWNRSLKAICLRIGEAFARTAGQEGDFYGKLYRRRLALEAAVNDRRCPEEKLPPGHLAARARRWTVKLFLAHYHHVAWTLATGAPPAKPYAIGVLGRSEYIAPPNFGEGAR